MGRLDQTLAGIPASIEFQPAESESLRRGPLGRARVWVMLETDVRGLREAISAIGLDRGVSLHSISVEAIDPGAPAEMGEILAIRLEAEGWFMAADSAGPEEVS